MPIIESGSIATTASVGSNAFSGVFAQADPKIRLIKRIAVVGSSAVGDAVVDMFLGVTYIGTYRNTTASNAPIEAKDWITVNMVAEPLEPINARLVTAPTTNAMRIFIEYEYLQ